MVAGPLFRAPKALAATLFVAGVVVPRDGLFGVPPGDAGQAEAVVAASARAARAVVSGVVAAAPAVVVWPQPGLGRARGF
ncbi:MAG TPA: hypothetical protein PLO16_00420 [Acidocella sp.]|nr:hypothetical protein [Acidocella sp.]